MKYSIYMFLLYSDLGKKVKDVLNSLIPGLIPEPQRVRVPVRRPDEGRYRERR